MRLRLATYNIHRGTGEDGRENLARTHDVLRELDADIVALQEVGYRAGADPEDVLAELGRGLFTYRVAGVTMQDERGGYGNAVLSRLPFLEVDRVDISLPGVEPRGAIELGVETMSTGVRLLATHLGLRASERRDQIDKLLQRVARFSAPVHVLLGDLNEWLSWARPLRRLRGVFGPVSAPATFPARRPRFALDRIWVKPASAVRHLTAHRSPLARIASDHLPLVADLKLPLVR